MLGFQFAGNFTTAISLSGLDILLTCCVGAIAVAFICKYIGLMFKHLKKGRKK